MHNHSPIYFIRHFIWFFIAINAGLVASSLPSYSNNTECMEVCQWDQNGLTNTSSCRFFNNTCYFLGNLRIQNSSRTLHFPNSIFYVMGDFILKNPSQLDWNIEVALEENVTSPSYLALFYGSLPSSLSGGSLIIQKNLILEGNLNFIIKFTTNFRFPFPIDLKLPIIYLVEGKNHAEIHSKIIINKVNSISHCGSNFSNVSLVIEDETVYLRFNYSELQGCTIPPPTGPLNTSSIIMIVVGSVIMLGLCFIAIFVLYQHHQRWKTGRVLHDFVLEGYNHAHDRDIYLSSLSKDPSPSSPLSPYSSEENEPPKDSSTEDEDEIYSETASFITHIK